MVRDVEMTYIPAGKYTTAGVVVVELQDPGAQRLPLLIAFCIAAVSYTRVSEVAAEACGRCAHVCSPIAGGSKVFDIAEDCVASRVRVKGCDALMLDILKPIVALVTWRRRHRLCGSWRWMVPVRR